MKPSANNTIHSETWREGCATKRVRVYNYGKQLKVGLRTSVGEGERIGREGEGRIGRGGEVRFGKRICGGVSPYRIN